MITYHRVPDDEFTALASGLGGPTAVARLASIQHSKHLLLLRFLAGAYRDDQAGDGAVDVLVSADWRDRLSVAELIADPMVGAWLVRTVRRLQGKDEDSTAPSDLAQIGALAAAAAIRTGLDAEVRTEALSGAVTLPTLGAAVLGSDGPATVTTSDGRATVTGGSARVAVAGGAPGWRELRRLAAHHGDMTGSLVIEDGNPYRDCYHAPAADRLSTAEVRHWQDQFGEAWHLMATFLPERAAELATGLRSVVPLVTTDDGVARSGTARDVFGTLGLTRPPSAADLAITLVHEFQHSKLSVLLDVVPLYVPDGVERHFAPWRTDARPTGGLIQGVYAFLGVADTWRALCADSALEKLATREFAFAREQVTVGIAALEASTELTPAGREFTAGLRQALDGLRREHVPESALATAIKSLDRRRQTWISHNSDVSAAGAVAR